MTHVKRRYSKEEIARRGDAIYQNDVLPALNAEDQGKFVAIDIETGRFEISADEIGACGALHQRSADAQIWLVRVGSRYLHRFGRLAERTIP